jgi:hypothetical protein
MDNMSVAKMRPKESSIRKLLVNVTFESRYVRAGRKPKYAPAVDPANL